MSCYDDMHLLKKFLKREFSFTSMRKMGIFTKEMRYNHVDQANAICKWFGIKCVYEYGLNTVSGHLSYDRTIEVDSNGSIKTQPFIEVFLGHEDNLKKAIEGENYLEAEYYKKILQHLKSHSQ